MYLKKIALIKEQDFNCKHICYTKSGQYIAKSIKPNPKALDKTLVGYLEFKGGSNTLILFT